VAEGHLACSGKFVVEEEEEEQEEEDEGRPDGVYRRLIFLKNEGVVQTEVRGWVAIVIQVMLAKCRDGGRGNGCSGVAVVRLFCS